MNKTVWWILLASIFVALLVMLIAFIIMRINIKKVKTQYQKDIASAHAEVSRAVARENHGELLWELKAKSKMPLGDKEMEFLINTSLRNEYKTFSVMNSASDYEEKSFVRLAKLKASKIKTDFVVIFNKDTLQEDFDMSYKLLKEKQMIAIVDAPRKNKEIKKLIDYLKITGAKYEWNNIGKGIVLVVK